MRSLSRQDRNAPFRGCMPHGSDPHRKMLVRHTLRYMSIISRFVVIFSRYVDDIDAKRMYASRTNAVTNPSNAPIEYSRGLLSAWLYFTTALRRRNRRGDIFLFDPFIGFCKNPRLAGIKFTSGAFDDPVSRNCPHCPLQSPYFDPLLEELLFKRGGVHKYHDFLLIFPREQNGVNYERFFAKFHLYLNTPAANSGGLAYALFIPLSTHL